MRVDAWGASSAGKGISVDTQPEACKKGGRSPHSQTAHQLPQVSLLAFSLALSSGSSESLPIRPLPLSLSTRANLRVWCGGLFVYAVDQPLALWAS